MPNSGAYAWGANSTLVDHRSHGLHTRLAAGVRRRYFCAGRWVDVLHRPLANDHVADRTDRVEPRVIKRRPKQYDLMDQAPRTIQKRLWRLILQHLQVPFLTGPFS